MAAFFSKDPKDKVAFDAHWDKILNLSQNTTRTIVAEGQVAGHISCYRMEKTWKSPIGWEGSSGEED